MSQNPPENLPEVASHDLLALACFLAKYQDDLNDLRYKWIAMSAEDCKSAVIGQWPIIQGTTNQINLKRVGEIPYESPQVSRAIKAILEANS
jgi:hypothetical protein